MSRSYTIDEKIWYVENFKESGLSIKSFCKNHDIPETTVRGWLSSDTDMPLGAIAIDGTNIETKKPVIKKTTIFAGGDFRIEVKEDFDKVLFKQVAEVMLNVK